jgi:pimeloyl-ACP methyl ester carboxylesterase
VDIQKVLDELARNSGYSELAVAPLFFVGHSAGGPQAKAAARRYRERCFGVVQYRGGSPGGEETVLQRTPNLSLNSGLSVSNQRGNNRFRFRRNIPLQFLFNI